MIKARAPRIETGFNVTKTFAPRQLGEDHANKLAPAGKLGHLAITSKAGYATLKLLRVDSFKKLSQDKFAGVHLPRLSGLSKNQFQIAHIFKPHHKPSHT